MLRRLTVSINDRAQNGKVVPLKQIGVTSKWLVKTYR